MKHLDFLSIIVFTIDNCNHWLLMSMEFYCEVELLN